MTKGLKKCSPPIKINFDDKLGDGGFGNVYITENPSFVAKVLRFKSNISTSISLKAGQDQDQEEEERDPTKDEEIWRQIHASNLLVFNAGIKSKYVVQAVCKMSIEDGRKAYILPVYPDGDFESWLKKQQREDSSTTSVGSIHWCLSTFDAKNYILQMILGVFAFHQHRLAHFDVKLSNFLKNGSLIALNDFDGAKIYGEPSSIGDKLYKPPELYGCIGAEKKKFSLETGAHDWYMLGRAVEELKGIFMCEEDRKDEKLKELIRKLKNTDPEKRNFDKYIHELLNDPYLQNNV